MHSWGFFHCRILQAYLFVVSLAMVVVLVVVAIPMAVAVVVVGNCMGIAVFVVAISMVIACFVFAVVIAVVVPVLLVELISVELLFPSVVMAPVCMFAARRERAVISIMRVEVMVDISMKACRSAEPRSGAEKHASRKPLRPVIAKRGARIRCVVEVAIGTHWRHANAGTDLC